MPNQLDILALEPFFGGARRHMLETVIRCSRHRWTLLKLPPRRMERRLSTAASWFAEQLSRHWSGRVDILFTSEAMNLSSLYRSMPTLAHTVSVVYFHDNQFLNPQKVLKPKLRQKDYSHLMLGRDGATTVVEPPTAKPTAPADEMDLELVNLTTATAATEIWFNSRFHQRAFLAAAAKLVEQHPELSGHSPMPAVNAKSHVMHPPVDLNLVPHVKSSAKLPPRDSRAIFVDTRDARVRMLNAALSELASRGEKFRLITIGPVEELSTTWPRRTIPETNDMGHVTGLCEAGVVLSIRPNAATDLQMIRGLQAGCRPVLPNSGVYPEIIPAQFHRDFLYAADNVDELANCLQDAVNPAMEWIPPDFRPAVKPFEAIAATKLLDERLSQLAQAHPPVDHKADMRLKGGV